MEMDLFFDAFRFLKKKTAGNFAQNNFKYILLNNNTHDSVGGQVLIQTKLILKDFLKAWFKNFIL